MRALRIEQVDGSSIIRIPNEIIERFRVEAGDAVLFNETARGFEIVFEPEFARDMRASAEIADRYKGALKKLADS
jgi:hypothetical protein